MTTKKKDTPSDRESKADSFDDERREAMRQAQRADEIRASSAPTMKEIFSAFERFRSSFKDALEAVDGFVSESKRVSDELRKEDCESKADSLSGWADEWAEVTSQEFRDAATGLVDLVRNALVTGYPVHVLTVAKRLRLRGKAEWGRLCDSLRYALRTDSQALSAEQSEGLQLFAVTLIDSLKEIDGRAEHLTPEQVVKAANNKRTTKGSGFAAELACMCGAWEYKPDDQVKAQQAITQAMRGGA